MNKFSLDNHPKIVSGFRTPEGYFDTFEERLMQQLPVREPKVVPLYRRRPFWASAAAAVVVLGGSLMLYFGSAHTSAPDDTAIENYLVYEGNISSYDLIQNLNESDIDALEQSVAVSDDAIINYLDDQNIILNN